MFARQRSIPSLRKTTIPSLPAHLERYIYSFLLQDNLDLINPQELGISDPDRPIFTPRSSTFSIIRRVCKGSKDLTEAWQRKIAQLGPSLLSDSEFKKFYINAYKVMTNIRNRREAFVVKDTMLPLLNRMSKEIPPFSLIPMLQKVFSECDSWTNVGKQSFEGKNDIDFFKFELSQFYMQLKQLQQQIELNTFKEDVPPLSDLQKQFKFLLMERILLLIFKTNINTEEKTHKATKAKIELKSDSKTEFKETPAYKVVVHVERDAALLTFLCCIIPPVACAALAGSLMPDSRGRDAVLTVSCLFAGVCALFFIFQIHMRRNTFNLDRLSQTFRDRFLENMDSQYGALEQGEENPSDDKKSVSAGGQQNSEAECKEHRLDIPSPRQS